MKFSRLKKGMLFRLVIFDSSELRRIKYYGLVVSDLKRDKNKNEYFDVAMADKNGKFINKRPFYKTHMSRWTERGYEPRNCNSMNSSVKEVINDDLKKKITMDYFMRSLEGTEDETII